MFRDKETQWDDAVYKFEVFFHGSFTILRLVVNRILCLCVLSSKLNGIEIWTRVYYKLPTFQNLNENVERAGNTPCSGGCRGVGNPPAGRVVWGEGGSPHPKRGPGVSPGGSPGGKAPWSGGPGGEAHPGTRPCHRPLGTTQKVPEPDHKKWSFITWPQNIFIEILKDDPAPERSPSSNERRLVHKHTQCYEMIVRRSNVLMVQNFIRKFTQYLTECQVSQPQLLIEIQNLNADLSVIYGADSSSFSWNGLYCLFILSK